jgi:hypothetical protein
MPDGGDIVDRAMPLQQIAVWNAIADRKPHVKYRAETRVDLI